MAQTTSSPTVYGYFVPVLWQEARGEAWHLPVFSAETPLHPADPSLRGRPERQGRSDPEQVSTEDNNSVSVLSMRRQICRYSQLS